MTPLHDSTMAASGASLLRHDSHATGRPLPDGLPDGASVEQVVLSRGADLALLTIPLAGPDAGEADRGQVAHDETAALAAIASDWVAAAGAAPGPASVNCGGLPAMPLVNVPLYGCHVTWARGNAAVIGPPNRIESLRTAVIDFARCEAELGDAESRAATLLEVAENDAATAFDIDELPLTRRGDLAKRYHEAVAIRRKLALLATAIHVAPVHPPTLTSQLSERLRDRTRLAERHERAVELADLAERVAETCGNRAAELGIARRQFILEAAIVVLLVVQTSLLVVELLAARGPS